MLRKFTFLLLVFTSFFLVACGEPAEREAKYVERAKALFEKGDYERAIIELSNAQQINPEGIESTYYQGLIKEAEGDLSGALRRFQKVLEYDAANLKAILKIGNIYLITNMLDEAEAMAAKAAALAPDNADLGALKAGIALRRDDTEEARKLAEAVLARDPSHVASAGILARILSDRGENEAALAVLDQAIQLNPKNQNLRRVKILLHLENGDLASAEKVYFELFKLEPEFFDYRKELVRQYIAYGRLDDGEKVLRELIAEFPAQIEAKRLLVDFLLNQRGFAVAEQEMLTFLAEDPKNDDLRLDLAGIYRTHGLPEKAEVVYRDVLNSGRSDKAVVLSQIGLAQILLDRGEIAPAATLLDKVLSKDPENGTALLLRSKVYLSEDDYPRAILNLRTLLQQEPSARAGMVLLAQAHLMAKQPGLAMEALQRLNDIDPTNDRAQLLLASLYVWRGDLDEASILVDQVLARDPQNTVALAAKFRLLLSLGAWAQAESVASEVAGLEGGAAMGHSFRGQLLRRQGLFSEAAAEFHSALALDPAHNDALAGLIATYLLQDRAADAEKLLKGRLEGNSDDAMAQKLLGDVLQQRSGATEMARKAYEQAIALQPSWAEPYLRLALIYRAVGDTTRATEILDAGLANAPGDEALIAAQDDRSDGRVDPSKSYEAYEDLILHSEESVEVANNLVALVTDYDIEDDPSLPLSEKIFSPFERTKQPAILDTLGWVHYRLGNYRQAIDFLNRALSNGGDTPQVRYHLGMVYLGLGEADRARRELEAAVQSETAFPGIAKARQALAQL